MITLRKARKLIEEAHQVLGLVDRGYVFDKESSSGPTPKGTIKRDAQFYLAEVLADFEIALREFEEEDDGVLPSKMVSDYYKIRRLFHL